MDGIETVLFGVDCTVFVDKIGDYGLITLGGWSV